MGGVRSRSIKGRDTASLAEVMLGGACIEGIGLQIVCALEEFKLLGGNDEVEKSLFLADGAVAGEDGEVFDPSLKLDCSAVAATAKASGDGGRNIVVHGKVLSETSADD